MPPLNSVVLSLTAWSLPLFLTFASASALAANCAEKVVIGQVTSSGGSNPTYSVALQRTAGGALMVELAMLAFPTTVNVPKSTISVDMKTARNLTVSFASGPGLDVNAVDRKMDAFYASKPTLTARNCYYPHVQGF
jgi:spore coat protein U-like protein